MERVNNNITNTNNGERNNITVTITESPEQKKKEEKKPAAKEDPPLEKTLFISHASQDKEIVDPFVKMLLDAGFPREKLFYSSCPALGVPLGEKIDECVRRKLNKGTFVIFMLSHNWNSSIACANEFGVAWHEDLRHCNILLPGFFYRDIGGLVPQSELSASYDDPMLGDRLGQLKRQLEKHFDMEFIDSAWENSRKQFLCSIHCDSAAPRPI